MTLEEMEDNRNAASGQVLAKSGTLEELIRAMKDSVAPQLRKDGPGTRSNERRSLHMTHICRRILLMATDEFQPTSFFGEARFHLNRSVSDGFVERKRAGVNGKGKLLWRRGPNWHQLHEEYGNEDTKGNDNGN